MNTMRRILGAMLQHDWDAELGLLTATAGWFTVSACCVSDAGLVLIFNQTVPLKKGIEPKNPKRRSACDKTPK